jgi:hypothetical protein
MQTWLEPPPVSNPFVATPFDDVMSYEHLSGQGGEKMVLDQPHFLPPYPYAHISLSRIKERTSDMHCTA